MTIHGTEYRVGCIVQTGFTDDEFPEFSSIEIKGVQRPHVVIPNGIQTIKSCNINSIKYYYIMLILSFSIVKSILFDSK